MCSLFGFDCSLQDWSDVAAIATILGGAGIVLAFLQIRHQSEIARSTFENLFMQQYQQLIQKIPTRVLLGETMSPVQREECLSELYHYVDLCNAQAYHYRQGRISTSTWEEWRSGIECNLRRPELRRFWSYVAAKSPGEFADLRSIVLPDEYDVGSPYLGH